MKKISLLLLCVGTLHAVAQTDSLKAIEDIRSFQKELNEQYKNRDESPLAQKDFDKFEGHDFFPIDLAYRVQAKLTVTEGTPFFGMKTTTSRIDTERVYGYVTFSIEGNEFRLPVYQSKDLMQSQEYADYLFFPFTDDTNGAESYAGGRYIDLRIPKEGDSLVIDFNKAYNPYCAYSSRYSCPLVPAENQMTINVRAGVRYHKKEQSTVDGQSTVFTAVDAMPEFPGGHEAMVKYILKNMSYPKAAKKAKVHGVVYVQFVVDRDGSITDVNILKSLSKECDSEAERVVSGMPKWKPGQIDGETVAVQFVLPLRF